VKTSSAVRAGCVENGEPPAKTPRVDDDVKPAEDPDRLSANEEATVGEKMSFFMDLTASEDCELLPNFPAEDRWRASVTSDRPLGLTTSRQESCQNDDNCTCSNGQQLCTSTLPVHPKWRADIGDDSCQQTVNGVRDASRLKTQCQNAADTNGCHDSITEDCSEDLIIPTSGFPALEPAVVGVMVNGGTVLENCSL